MMGCDCPSIYMPIGKPSEGGTCDLDVLVGGVLLKVEKQEIAIVLNVWRQERDAIIGYSFKNLRN